MTEQQQIYLTKIKPLMYQVYSYCNTYGIPMFAAYGFDEWDDDEKAELRLIEEAEEAAEAEEEEAESKKKKKEMVVDSNILDLPLDMAKEMAKGKVLRCHTLLPQVVGANEYDKRFARFVNVVNGFETVLKERIEIFDVDDIAAEDLKARFGQESSDDEDTYSDEEE